MPPAGGARVDVFGKLRVIRGGERPPRPQAMAPRREPERTFGGDVQRVGPNSSMQVGDAASGHQRQADFGIRGTRYRAEAVRRDRRDFVSHPLASSRIVLRSVTTTPLICGVHASVTIRMRMRAFPGSRHALGCRHRCRLRLARAAVHRARFLPTQDRQRAVVRLDEGGEALDPVAGVAVEDVADRANFA